MYKILYRHYKIKTNNRLLETSLLVGPFVTIQGWSPYEGNISSKPQKNFRVSLR